MQISHTKAISAPKQKTFAEPLHLSYPFSIEFLVHVNELFCFHLFIDLPEKMKIDILHQYYFLHVYTKTPKLDHEYSSYVNELMRFHAAMIHQDQCLVELWKLMLQKAIRLQKELKVIMRANQHHDILPHEKMISLEQVYSIQAELQKSTYIRPFTF